MGKKTSYTSKIWFARGFHDYIVGQVQIPDNDELIEYYKETLSVDIVQEYCGGVKAAQSQSITDGE